MTLLLQKNLWESEVLNRPVYNLKFKNFDSKNFEEIKNQIHNLDKKTMVYSRFPINQTKFKNFLKDQGFYKVDTYLYLKNLKQKRNFKHVNNNFILRMYKNSDFQKIGGICNEVFNFSRFHNDANISNNYANKSRLKWFEDSLNNNKKKVYTYSYKNEVVGFLIEKNGKKKTIDLIGISNKYQQKGHGTNLLRQYLKNNSKNNIYVGTQLKNHSALNLYFENNFTISKVYSTFHLHI